MRSNFGLNLRRLLSFAISLLFVLPLYWAFIASLRTPGSPPPRSVEWWISNPRWQNYADLFTEVPMALYLRNSIFVVVLAVPITLIVASMAGFSMTQLTQRWQRVLVSMSIMLLIIPAASVWLFRFEVLLRINVLDTLFALILPSFAGTSPLYVLLFYWSFRRIPAEVFEAARLDGAGVLSMWWRVAVPMVKPTIAGVTMLSFVTYWSDFVGPVLYVFDLDFYTLPFGLQIINQGDITNWPLRMAASVLMIGPVLLLFAYVQRFFLGANSLSVLVGQD